MKTTLKELQEKHAMEITKLEKENAIREMLPDSIRESAMICIHGDHASVKTWTDFRTDKKLSDAMPIYEAFKSKIIQGEHWKDGCCSTWPAPINGNAKRQSAVMDGSHEVEIDVSGGRNYGPCVEIQFWIESQCGLIEFSIPVCDLWKLVPSVRANYGHNGDLTSCDIRWPADRAIVDSFRTWYSEKPSYKASYYFADTFSFESWASNQKSN